MIREWSIVKVEGSVSYGDKKYDVNCIGTVAAIYPRTMLVNLDEVDGDRKVGCIVKNKYITELSRLEVLNILLGSEYETEEDALEFLSERFSKHYEKFDDGQLAYNYLDNEYSNYLSILGLVYSLFDGESWHISINEDCSLEELKTCFSDENISDFEDIEDLLERKVMKTMSNAGCDVFSALSLELEEISIDRVEELIKVIPEDINPIVEFMD